MNLTFLPFTLVRVSRGLACLYGVDYLPWLDMWHTLALWVESLCLSDLTKCRVLGPNSMHSSNW